MLDDYFESDPHGLYGAVEPLTSMTKFRQARDRAYKKLHTPVEAHQNRWNPYSFEGGTVAAVAGADFALLASDSRMSQFDVNILSREAEKIHALSETVVLATAGFYGDVLQMKRMLRMRMSKYAFDYRSEMSADLVSELLARNLYYRRFFPLFTGAILAGITEKGEGAVYSYDPVGMIEKVPYAVSGTANSMIEPFFDCQFGYKTVDKSVVVPSDLSLDRAMSVVKDAFRMATERDAQTGDRLHLVVVRKGKPVENHYFGLRED